MSEGLTLPSLLKIVPNGNPGKIMRKVIQKSLGSKVIIKNDEKSPSSNDDKTLVTSYSIARKTKALDNSLISFIRILSKHQEIHQV